MEAPADSATRAESIVASEFRDTWAAYYAWEPSYCAEKLASLQGSLPRLEPTEDLLDPFASLGSDWRTPGSPHDDSDSGQPESTFTQYIIDAHGQATSSVVRAVTTTQGTPLPPYPTYEFCTPVSWNISHGDDPIHAPFIPLADDPSFDFEDWAFAHEDFRWQQAHLDPDGAWHT